MSLLSSLCASLLMCFGNASTASYAPGFATIRKTIASTTIETAIPIVRPLAIAALYAADSGPPPSRVFSAVRRFGVMSVTAKTSAMT